MSSDQTNIGDHNTKRTTLEEDERKKKKKKKHHQQQERRRRQKKEEEEEDKEKRDCSAAAYGNEEKLECLHRRIDAVRDDANGFDRFSGRREQSGRDREPFTRSRGGRERRDGRNKRHPPGSGAGVARRTLLQRR